mmetsp:Transcript_36026/g.102895  ORF Transcript_36026/g.102895 Transcript_36026/m.102895 type:complete len:309 (+) Transcript_36026:72-998(+)
MLARARLMPVAHFALLAQLAAGAASPGTAVLAADDACAAGAAAAKGQEGCALSALQQHKRRGPSAVGAQEIAVEASPGHAANASGACAGGAIFVAHRSRRLASRPAKASLGRIYGMERVREYYYADYDSLGNIMREYAASKHPNAKLMIVEVFDWAGFQNASFTPAELALVNQPGGAVYVTASDCPSNPGYQMANIPGGCDNPTAAMPHPGAGEVARSLLDGQATVRQRTTCHARPGVATNDLLDKVDDDTAWVSFNPGRAAVDEPAVAVASGQAADELVHVHGFLGLTECQNDQFWANVAKLAGCDV